eukprot:CAMPEP_0114366096 /NCGR_PEP_ID=MMETSP0101-20121206/28973_1 /TAXON_ID=38822 ORGANISM="Pteridomonas danica, Strain PT" /NCGR_SAMPLE_ID=MMETSP0101 /ASSEMBLY_ACC=CAM_ASM_000211 /LENGTH=897 /DNA_ID=CAMNT_0001514893 /DNA_START=224 /DNA_END=2914 /DNA_ORIENTATION=+
MYLITATLTTVGLGDVSPSKQGVRLIAILVLPYGLIIFAFVMALTAATAESKLIKTIEQELQAKKDAEEELDEDGNPVVIEEMEKSNQFRVKVDDETDSLVIGCRVVVSKTMMTILMWLFKYVLVILLGAAFFRLYEPEVDAQHDAGVDMTWIDALFFATVVSTTVGYGHEIWAQTFGAKLFCCFYFLISSFVVGGILGHFSNLYLQLKEDEITNEIINDLSHVHNVDLECNGQVNEAEFVMYKLLQLQHYDKELVRRLSNKYSELDSGDNGRVLIGQDVPSAEQVAAFDQELFNEKRRKEGEGGKNKVDKEEEEVDPDVFDSIPLIEKWNAKKTQLTKQRVNSITQDAAPPKRSNSLVSLFPSANDGNDIESVGRKKEKEEEHVTKDEDYVELQDLDFDWSKSLWRKAALNIGTIVLLMMAVYAVLGWYVFIYDSSQMNQVQGWYFIVATLTMVGFGDFAPETQSQRLSAIFMIPFGLIILGFAISFFRAYALSLPYKPQKVEDGSIRRIFETLGIPEDGFLTKEQFVKNAKLVEMSPKKAEQFFDTLDYSGDGKMYMPKNFIFFETILGRTLVITSKLYCTILIGGIAMKCWPSEDNLTWIDALYFATVTSTSIGYGDITPVSDSFRIFLIFYMLISTVVVGFALSDALEIYLRDFMSEPIFDLMISSSTHVYKADVDKTGVITEAEYIIFKLQQMQRLDTKLLNRLMDQFDEIDFDNTRMLLIGVHIPNEAQTLEMQREIKGTKLTMIEAWEAKKAKIMTELGFDENGKLKASVSEVRRRASLPGNSLAVNTSEQEDIDVKKGRRGQSVDRPPSPIEPQPKTLALEIELVTSIDKPLEPEGEKEEEEESVAINPESTPRITRVVSFAEEESNEKLNERDLEDSVSRAISMGFGS